jgi:hypothetical protein
MLSLAAERSLSLSSSSLCRASTVVPGIRFRSLHSTSDRPKAFAYISRKRNQQVVTVAMSSLSRRHASSSPGPSSKPSSKLDAHSHSHADHNHDHGHSHDGHDHSHSGIFHSHAHDHSEGAEQIMTALSKGTLDRGTRITLLGQYPICNQE